MLHMLFKSFEGVILDKRDSLFDSFLSLLLQLQNGIFLKLRISLLISQNWICPLHPHIEQYVSSSICF